MNLYYRIRSTISSLWHNFRVRCQRFRLGYSYSDVWNMDDWFIRTVKPMLIHLRDHGCSVPGEFADNHNGWGVVLTKMISCLDMMDEGNVYKHLGFCDIKDYERMTTDDYKEIDKIMEENKNRFFELFSKYFYNLWD